MRAFFLLIALLPCACGSPSVSEVGDMSRDEAAALNDAAEMLVDNRAESVPVG